MKDILRIFLKTKEGITAIAIIITILCLLLCVFVKFIFHLPENIFKIIELIVLLILFLVTLPYCVCTRAEYYQNLKKRHPAVATGILMAAVTVLIGATILLFITMYS